LRRTVTHKTADCREKHSFGFRSLRAATDVHLQDETLEVVVHALCAKFEVSPGAEEERAVVREIRKTNKNNDINMINKAKENELKAQKCQRYC
jgi:hypothetical protein